MLTPIVAALLALATPHVEWPCLPPGVSADVVTRVPAESRPALAEREDGSAQRVVVAQYRDGAVTSVVVWHRADVIFYDPDAAGDARPLVSAQWLTDDLKLRRSPTGPCAWRQTPAPEKE
jgi:hypothetical protein